ncbi:MAG: hypothetical protein ACRELC_08720 [Gemmatimonadota bacterium]
MIRDREGRSWVRGVVLAALFGATPAGAAQPQAGGPVVFGCREPEPRKERAAVEGLAGRAATETLGGRTVTETFDGRTVAALEEGGGWNRAAALLARAARLRPPCDPTRFAALREAAYYYRFSGEMELASATMFEAAEQGANRGDVIAAAHAFIDAASWALEAGHARRAGEAARRATLLAQSPLICPAQRLHIRGRAATIRVLAAES